MRHRGGIKALMPEDPTEARQTEEAEEASATPTALDQSGLCSQAQADGVPCKEVGGKCEICEEAEQSAGATAR